MEAYYELTYIIRPDMEDAAKKELVERFDKILTDQKANISKSADWETRKLAYDIEGYREGTYHIINFKADDDAAINEFDRLAKINENILRHMVVIRDENANSEKKPVHRPAPAAAKPEAEASKEA